MEAFWEDYTWGKLVFKRCSHCKKLPLELNEYDVLSPYCPWCGCRMINAEEE